MRLFELVIITSTVGMISYLNMFPFRILQFVFIRKTKEVDTEKVEMQANGTITSRPESTHF